MRQVGRIVLVGGSARAAAMASLLAQGACEVASSDAEIPEVSRAERRRSLRETSPYVEEPPAIDTFRSSTRRFDRTHPVSPIPSRRRGR